MTWRSGLKLDDLQIYDHSPQSSCSSLVVRMSNCVAEINEWVGSNRLKLNPSKTELFQYQIDRLQSVLRAAARLVLGLPKWASVSDAMHDELHWLPFPERVEFKLCSVVYKCLHESAPRYLSQYCIPVASLPGRSHLRSAASGDLFVPATSTKTIGPREFFYAGPAVLNCLLSSLKDPNITFSVFKNCLKLNFSNTEHSRMRLCGSLLERRRCNTSIIIIIMVGLFSFPYSCRVALIPIQLSCRSHSHTVVGLFSFPYSCRVALISH